MAFGILYGLRVTGIYKILNTVNGKFYVGSSVQIESRIFKHLAQLRKGKHNNWHLQSAYTLDGEDAFDFILLEGCDRADLLTREQHYMDTLEPEYNICRIAGNTLGVLHTAITKAKMTISQRGNTNHLGKSHTDATKQKLRLKAALRTHTAATKAAISNKLLGNQYTKGKALSKAHKEKVSTASLKMWNGCDSAQRLQAASDRAKARWADPLWRLTNMPKIIEGKRAAKLLKKRVKDLVWPYNASQADLFSLAG